MSGARAEGPRGLHHVALRVADLERAQRFYGDLLGLEVLREVRAEGGSSRAVWLRAGDVVLMLELGLRGAGAESGSGHLLAFVVDDLGVWEKRLRAHGVPLKDRTPATLYVNDPDGHRVGLSVHRFDASAP